MVNLSNHSCSQSYDHDGDGDGNGDGDGDGDGSDLTWRFNFIIKWPDPLAPIRPPLDQ